MLDSLILAEWWPWLSAQPSLDLLQDLVSASRSQNSEGSSSHEKALRAPPGNRRSCLDVSIKFRLRLGDDPVEAFAEEMTMASPYTSLGPPIP